MNLFKFEINKDLVGLAIGNILRFLLLIIYTRLQTFFLSYEELSKFYLVFSLYTFFSFSIIGPIGVYVTRNIIEWYRSNQIVNGLRSIYIKLIIPIALLALVVISISGFFLDYDVNFISVSIIIFLIILTKTANELIYPFFNLIDKNFIYLVLIILFHVLNPLFSYWAIKNFSPTFDYWLVGLILSNLIVAIIGWRILNKISKDQKSIKIDYDTLKTFSFYIVLTNILGWTLTDGFRFLAESKIGLTSVGILILGLMGASQIFANVENFLNQLLSPKYLQNISNATFKDRSNAFNNLLTVSIPIYVAVALAMSHSVEIILNIIIDESKINNILINVFLIGIWIELLKSILNILKNITTSEYKTHAMIFPYLFGVVFLILTIYFDFFSDISSIAYLILISYGIVILTCILSLNRIIKIELNIFFILKRLLLIFSISLIPILVPSNLSVILIMPGYAYILYDMINHYLKLK